MSIKNRLILSFSMMITLTIFLGVLLIASSWILRSRYIDYSRTRFFYDLLSELTITFEKGRAALDGYIIGLNSEKDKFNASEIEIDRLLDRWGKMELYISEKDEKKKLETRLRTFRSTLSQVFRLVESDRRAEAIQVMESTVLPASDGIEKELKSLTASKKSQSERSWESAERIAGRTTLFSVLLLVSVLLAGSGFAILLYQSISRPLEKLTEGTKKIARGEWNLKLELAGPVELADLAHSFEEMAKSLTKLEAQVVQMDRMSTIGTLSGGVAHEINNPLTGVLGQAQLLLEKMSPDDPNRSNVEKIERAAQRCRKIVRGLLDFSRPTEYTFKAEDAESVIQSALALCESEMKALGIRVLWEKNPTLPKIWASDHQLQQVFLNIITNSMQAMPEGGTLTIQTQLHPSPYSSPSRGEEILEKIPSPLREQEAKHSRALVGGWGEGDFVEISFTDTGLGIEPQHLSHLFDPFFTTKEPGKGTGLGLSISYGIIQQHHGEIIPKSEGSGKGSTFIVRIPVATTESKLVRDRTARNLEAIEKQLAQE